MSQQNTDVFVRLPERAKPRWRDITIQQIGLFAITMTACFVLLVVGLKLVAIVILLIGVYEVLIPTSEGPRYSKQRDNLLLNRGIRKRDHYAFNPLATGKAAKKNFASEMRIYDFQRLGTLFNFGTHKDTFVLAATGRSGLSSGPADRFGIDREIVEVIKMVISQVPENVEISAINGRRPFDPTGQAEYEQRRYLSKGVTEALSPGDRWLRAQTDEGFNNLINLTGTPICQFAITVKRPRSWDKHNMYKTGTKPELLKGSSIERLETAARSGLSRAGYSGLNVLSGPGVHHSVFRSWNVSYVQPMVTDNQPGYDPNGDEWPETGVWAYPTYLRTGDSYQATLVIDRLRSNLVEPGGFDELLKNDIRWATLSLCTETVSPTFESMFLKKSYQWKDAWKKASTDGGYYETIEDVDKANEPMEAFNELYLSRSKALRFSIVITLSADSLEKLEANVADMESILRNLRFAWDRVTGEVQQLRVFFAATVGIRV